MAGITRSAKARILVVNAGSSSLKLTLLGPGDEMLAERTLAAPRATLERSELTEVLAAGLGQADVVGHRIVHGGERFREAVLIDRDVEAGLRRLTALAPLHQPKSLAALDAVSAALPGVSAVACFDTAFHAGLPVAARTYALPAVWRERWPIQRYGFHGLSHAWVARRLPQLLGRPGAELRIVSCHLGAGASLCAIAAGRSVDTTMGFTPLEGLVMATRSGSVDPGLVLWLLDRGLSTTELSEGLEHEAGLRGLAGTSDMREVLSRSAAGDSRAKIALEVYLHRLGAGIAAMAASLGGLDALAFTGGVGENAPEVRAGALERLGFLGLVIDPERNTGASGDADLTGPEAKAHTVVVRAREELEIARQVRRVIDQVPTPVPTAGG